ncbi:hypothetical protein V6U78_10440 [Marinospirillum sp. MEB164]|uniref:Uncharacterized protein n=1 Tax=Marinospirillum alkalitolerans TaxID=3123374 RepID=A0ABW8PZZ6_9GAMM
MLARRNFLCCFILLCLLMLQGGCDGSSSSGSDDWHDDDDWYEESPPEPVPPPNYTHDLMQYGPHWGGMGPALDHVELLEADRELVYQLSIGGEYEHIINCQMNSLGVGVFLPGAYFHEHLAERGPASEYFANEAKTLANRFKRQPGALYASLLSLNHAIAFYPQFVAVADAVWEVHEALYRDFREVFWPECIQNIPTACFELGYKFIDFEARCAEGRVKLSTLPGYEMLREAYIEVQNQTGVRLE